MRSFSGKAPTMVVWVICLVLYVVAVAAAFGLLVRTVGGAGNAPLAGLFSLVTLTNIGLALFNLIPIPPLDGSSVLFALLPPRYQGVQLFLIRYGFYLLIALLLFDGFRVLDPIVIGLYRLFVGGA